MFFEDYQEFNSPSGPQPLYSQTVPYGEKSFFEYNVPGDGPCHHRKAVVHLTPFKGTRTLGFWYYRPDWYERINSLAGITKTASRVDLTIPPADIAALLAKTNPTKPSVSIPNFFIEMKDIPNMIRLDGLKLLSKGGKKNPLTSRLGAAFLSGHFAWGPLIGDLLKMYDFHKSADKTFDRLKRSHGERGTSGKLTFGTVSGSNVLIDDNFVNGRGDRRTTSSIKRWGSVRWKATNAFPNTEDAAKAISRLSTFGLTDPVSVIWEAIPWSWLIDWFTNASEFIAAHSNNLFVEPSDIWDHHLYSDQTIDENVWVHPGKQPENDNLSPGMGEAYRTDYYRFNAGPATLTATLPILNAGQVGTATSLILTRVRADR